MRSVGAFIHRPETNQGSEEAKWTKFESETPAATKSDCLHVHSAGIHAARPSYAILYCKFVLSSFLVRTPNFKMRKNQRYHTTDFLTSATYFSSFANQQMFINKILLCVCVCVFTFNCIIIH